MFRCLVFILILSAIGGNVSAQNGQEMSPQRHLELAEHLHRQGDCAEALKHVNKALAIQPANDEAFELRADINECLGDLNAAITDYSILIYNHPEDPEYLFSRGVLRYRTKRYAPAIEDLKKSLEYPLHETNSIYYKIDVGDKGISGLSTLETMKAETYNQIALAYQGLAEYDSTIAYFNRALDLGKNVQFFNNRALAYAEMDKAQQAISDFETALNMDETNQVAAYNLTRLYGDLKLYEKQRSVLDHIDSDIKLPEIHIYKGVAAYNSADYTSAVEEYDSAIALSKSEKEYYLYRGQAFEKLKRYNDAIDDFLTAIDLDDSYSNAYFALGNVFYQKNELDSALLNYDLAIFYDPKYANAFMNRGIVYLRKKSVDKACTDLATAKDLGLEEAKELYKKKCQDQ